MKYIFIFTLFLLLNACGPHSKQNNSNTAINESKDSIAVRVFNDYLFKCNRMFDPIPASEWLKNNSYFTDKYKEKILKEIDDSQAVDPEMGLEVDPIFKTQDFPDMGFTVDGSDSIKNTVFLSGKDLMTFKVLVQFELVDNQWKIADSKAFNIRFK
jgi:hypothetical protein